MTSHKAILDREFLESRCMILELAAFFDRYDRAGPAERSASNGDPRMDLLRKALSIMADPAEGPTRTQRILMLLSDPVD